MDTRKPSGTGSVILVQDSEAESGDRDTNGAESNGCVKVIEETTVG